MKLRAKPRMLWRYRTRDQNRARKEAVAGPLPDGRGSEWRYAFSLAEMMIALAILAMGLLVIGAALPIGVRYTQQSVNLATGEAAVEYALDLIEQNVSLPRTIFDRSTGLQNREPGLFQPRDPNGVFDPNYEPLIKVRPLFTQNVLAAPGPNYGEEYYVWNSPDPNRRLVLGEELIRAALPQTLGNNTNECDPCNPTRWLRPALPSVATVYPPISSDSAFLPAGFFADPYQCRTVLSPNTYPHGAETLKVLGQRTVWTGFYRRVSYARGSDPCLYEFIVVAVRLPSAKHRFPVQDPAAVGVALAARAAKASSEGSSQSSSFHLSGHDCGAPVPALIFFQGWLPIPPYSDTSPMLTGQRLLLPGFVAPATLRFTADPNCGPLLPPGSIFIPAVNDRAPTAWNAGPPPAVPEQSGGFVPSAPDALPIYEVIERNEIDNLDGSVNHYDIVVKNNGFYPWTMDSTARLWPVWVVPPAFEELSAGEPVFPDRSPIVGVGRRYIRLREIP